VSEHESDPFIEDIAGELKRPVRFDSTFESRVMAALDPTAMLPMEREKPTPWILRPRIFYVSPLAGLAVAAGLVAIITMSVLNTVPPKEIANSVSADTAAVQLQGQFIPAASSAPVTAPFTYIDRNAKSVAVVGNFNGWDATKDVLHLTSDGVWTGTVSVRPGRYEYQLVVDGKWIADPGAQQTAASEFGAANSVMIVSPVPR
jgi:AMP-activated protein kinase-like protein